jgi:phosphoglycolate phosphatase
MFDYTPIWREGAAFHPRPEGRGLHAAILMTAPITIACLDMAGTTVRDDGIVLDAFRSAIGGRLPAVADYNQAMKDVSASMGQSKIEVFRRILGDEEEAQFANQAFEQHHAAAVRTGQVAPLPGAVPVMTTLRAAAVKVCLLTGFSPATRDALIDALDWRPLIDLALSPADAGRGRPWPDLPLTALLRLGGGAVSELAVIGDTPSDVESGLRAGAGIVAGVLTGSTTREEFTRAGAPHILDTVAALPGLLGLS